jgi:hypothetical protein
MAVLWIAKFFELQHAESEALRQGERSAAAMASAFAGHVQRAITAASDIARDAARSPKQAAKDSIAARLSALAAANTDLIDAIAMVDGTERVVASVAGSEQVFLALRRSLAAALPADGLLGSITHETE